MTGELKHISVEGRGELFDVADAVRQDREPRVLEKDGVPIAAVVSIGDLKRLHFASPTPEAIERALGAAGSLERRGRRSSRASLRRPSRIAAKPAGEPLITHLVDTDWVIEYLRGRDEGLRILRPLIE